MAQGTAPIVGMNGISQSGKDDITAQNTAQSTEQSTAPIVFPRIEVPAKYLFL